MVVVVVVVVVVVLVVVVVILMLIMIQTIMMNMIMMGKTIKKLHTIRLRAKPFRKKLITGFRGIGWIFFHYPFNRIFINTQIPVG